MELMKMSIKTKIQNTALQSEITARPFLCSRSVTGAIAYPSDTSDKVIV